MKRGLITISLFIILFFLKGFFQNTLFQLSSNISRLSFIKVLNKKEDVSQEGIARILRENQGQLCRIEDLENENKNLKDYLELKKSLKEPIVANINSRIEEELRSRFLIDKGSRDGVRKNGAAITPEGFAGIVDDLGANFAFILPYFDPSFSISVRISSTREIALLTGRGKGCNPKLLYINIDSDIKIGDTVVTSGKGLLPKGIAIGRVVNIYMHASQMYKVADVEPFVDLSKVEDILIVVQE